jgi:hypothetical protein
MPGWDSICFSAGCAASDDWHDMRLSLKDAAENTFVATELF